MNTETLSYIMYTNDYGERFTRYRKDSLIAISDNKDLCDDPYQFGYVTGFEGKDFRCPYDCFSLEFFQYENGYLDGKFEHLEKVNK